MNKRNFYKFFAGLVVAASLCSSFFLRLKERQLSEASATYFLLPREEIKENAPKETMKILEIEMAKGLLSVVKKCLPASSGN